MFLSHSNKLIMLKEAEDKKKLKNRDNNMEIVTNQVTWSLTKMKVRITTSTCVREALYLDVSHRH